MLSGTSGYACGALALLGYATGFNVFPSTRLYMAYIAPVLRSQDRLESFVSCIYSDSSFATECRRPIVDELAADSPGRASPRLTAQISASFRASRDPHTISTLAESPVSEMGSRLMFQHALGACTHRNTGTVASVFCEPLAEHSHPICRQTF